MKSRPLAIVRSASRQFVDNLLLIVFNTLAIALLLPFDWKVAALLIALAAITTVAALYCGRRGVGHQRLLRSLFWAGGLATISWGIIGVFVVSDGPLYVVEGATDSILDARLFSAEVDSPDSVRCMVIADPLRAALARFLSGSGSGETRLIRLEHWEGEPHLVLPLGNAITRNVAGISAVDSELEVTVPFYGQTLSITESPDGSTDYSFGPSMATPVHFTYSTRGSRAQWNWVAINMADLDGAVRYSALIDLGLSRAGDADIVGALGALSAAVNVAPSSEETLRVLVLLAEASRVRLGGTVGRLQGASYYRQAFGTYAGLSSLRESPMIEWVRASLVSEALLLPELYPEISKRLLESAVADPIGRASQASGHENGPILRPLSNPEESFGLPHLRAGQENARGTEIAAREAFLYLSLHTLRRSLQVAKEHGEPCASRSAMEGLRGLNRVIAGHFEEDRSEWLRMVERIGASICEGAVDERDAVATYREGRLIETAALIELMEVAPLSGSEAPSFVLDVPPDSAWWSSEFLDWFARMSILLSGGAEVSVTPEFTFQHAIRDRRGEGDFFIPGLYASAVQNERVNTVEARQVIRQLERLVGSLERVRSTVFLLEDSHEARAAGTASEAGFEISGFPVSTRLEWKGSGAARKPIH